MTNKRQLKKYVRYVCGDLAAEIIIASRLFDGYDRDTVNKIISDIASLQQTTLADMSFAFDRTSREFANRAEYRRALKAYHKAAYNRLFENFDNRVNEIVKEMNEATPQTVRDSFKKAE